MSVKSRNMILWEVTPTQAEGDSMGSIAYGNSTPAVGRHRSRSS